MDKFRVLIVDDSLSEITAAATWLREGAGLLPAPPQVIPAGSVAEAAAVVRRCKASKTPINAAVVDLGLGPRQPSGLGAIRLLQETGVPVAVWTDWSERGGRLMFVYAAFTWYAPIALMPKARSTGGVGMERAARSFAGDISRVCRHEALAPDISAYFRPREGREWPFHHVLSSPADLRNWRALLTYSQTSAVAAHLGLSPRVIDRWLAEKYEAVRSLIEHASVYMEIDDVDIAQPPDDGGARGKDAKPGREAGKKAYLDRKAALHQFARSQSWFFTDPVVLAQYEASRGRSGAGPAAGALSDVRLQLRGVPAAPRCLDHALDRKSVV